MTKRSGLLAFMSVVLVGLALVSRAPGARPTPVITDTPIIVDLDETSAPIEATVTVGHTAEAETVPRYTEPDRAGVVAYVDGRFDDALELFSQAIADDPQDAESLNNLGQVLAKLGRYDEAVDRFEQALTINPSRWAYHFRNFLV